MDKIRISKQNYVFACLWACRHGRQDATVYTSDWGFIFFDPLRKLFGWDCAKLGTADIITYCDDVENADSLARVIEKMDAAGAWEKISHQVADDCGVNLEWVD